MAEDESGGFPPTKKAAVVAGGRHTDIVVSEYADRFLVIVTQLLKIGTVVQASVDAAHEKRKTYTGPCAVACACVRACGRQAADIGDGRAPCWSFVLPLCGHLTAVPAGARLLHFKCITRSLPR